MATFYGDWGTITRAGTTYKYRVYIIANITGAPDTYTLEITKAGFQVTSSKPATVRLEADSDDTGWFELYMNGSLVRKIYLNSYIYYVISKANEQKSAPIFEGSIKKTFSKTHSSQTASVKIGSNNIHIELYENGYYISYPRSPQETGTFSVPAKASYIISYNANGGTGVPSAQTKWHGEALTLSSTRPTRTGYTFAGWATSAGGSVAYQPGDSYAANSAVTLYAKWTPISVTLSYNANGGTGAPASQTKVYDTPLKLQTGTPTRTGYTFKGWATTQARANAGTVDYSAGGTYSANSTSNITLWAAWSPNPYAVTYNANGGSGAPASQTKYHGTNLTLQPGVPVKAGWLFRGWATSEANATARKNSGTAEYLPGGTYTGNEPLTLWAIWHAIYTYSLSAKRVGADKSSTEDANGEWVRIEVSITSAEASGNPITAITFTDEETAQSVSWYTTNDGSGSAISFPYQPTADNIKLYAWYQRTTASERAERYNLSVKVDDAIKTGDIKTTTLPPVFRLIDAKPPGKGIAFGKAATEDDLFECELDAIFNNGLKKINTDGTEIDYEISDATIALYDQLAGGTSWRE